MSYARLRGRIREIYGTQEAFAKDMKKDPTTISYKLNGKTEWTRQEIEQACGLLDISMEQMPLYFFAD
ncbi:MAG: DUF739 family protein [Akkermansia sp.]|nr:DUF739 family protein [Akkermansia sp.]